MKGWSVQVAHKLVDDHGNGSHALTIGTPVGSKSETLRVTTAMPCTNAVAAMSARAHRACLVHAAERSVTAVSIGNVRPENSGSI